MSQVLNERSVEIFEKELFIEICVEIAIRNCDRKNKASNWWKVCNSSFLSLSYDAVSARSVSLCAKFHRRMYRM